MAELAAAIKKLYYSTLSSGKPNVFQKFESFEQRGQLLQSHTRMPIFCITAAIIYLYHYKCGK